jgi:hypothetical protein
MRCWQLVEAGQELRFGHVRFTSVTHPTSDTKADFAEVSDRPIPDLSRSSKFAEI